jgi:flagellar biosynthesis protein FlhB
MAAHSKTEKATPKKRAEARKKGQVARSMDLNSAVVLLAALVGLSVFGPGLASALQEGLRAALALSSNPDVVSQRGLGALLGEVAKPAALATVPIAALCLVAGVATSVAQVRWKPSTQALKPDPRRINPLQGAKTIFGPHGMMEGAKSIVKVAVVGGVAAVAVFPELGELAGLVGMPPADLAHRLSATILAVGLRAAAAYVLLGALDYVWQRHRHEKQLRMDRQEVREEHKQNQLPPEVRAALRRRQLQAARARMMAAVPEADVVITNPTHYAVALAYDAGRAAPEVVAKGQDLVAAHIRRIAEENGVAVVSDPPLARSLHASAEVGQLIPEELYHAVAGVLAFVYRMARRRAV